MQVYFVCSHFALKFQFQRRKKHTSDDSTFQHWKFNLWLLRPPPLLPKMFAVGNSIDPVQFNFHNFHKYLACAEHDMLPRFIYSKIVLFGWHFMCALSRIVSLTWKFTLKMMAALMASAFHLFFSNSFIVNILRAIRVTSHASSKRTWSDFWITFRQMRRVLRAIVAYFLFALLKCYSFWFPETVSMTFLPFIAPEYYAARMAVSESMNCRASFQFIIIYDNIYDKWLFQEQSH